MIKRKKRPAESYEILTVPLALIGDDVTDGDFLAGMSELGENQFRGMASVFGKVVDAFTPTIMQRGAFTKTLQERSRSIPILWQHDMWQPIGRPIHLFENDMGLVLQAEISRTSQGRDALTLIRDGVISALSIGFEPVIFDFDRTDPENEFRFIREARLVEISVVTLGADPNAQITEVRSGFIHGSLEKYRAGHGVIFDEEEATTEEKHEVDTEGTESLGVRLDAFAAEYLTINPDATEDTILTAFSTTLDKAEPAPEESLTLSEVDNQLADAEFWLAETSLDTL